MANNTATLGTIILSAADLSVTMVDNSDPVRAGSPLSYTITVHNGGPLIALNVSLQDTLPSGLTFASMVPGQGSCTPGSPITCNLGIMLSGQSVNVTLFVTTTIDGSFTNVVSVGSSTHDQAPGNNSDSETTTVQPSADLSVTQVDDPDPVRASHPLTYTITVHNNGPSSSANVTLTDTLPVNVVFVSAEPDLNCNGTGPVVCTWSSLPASSNTQVKVVVTTLLDGSITNRVMVASTTPDQNLANNTSEEVTNVATDANLALTLMDTPDPVIAGDLLTYTAQVSNLGPSRAIGTSVSFDLSSAVTFIASTPPCSELGGIVTCSLGEIAANDSEVVNLTVQVSSSTFETQIVSEADVSSSVVDSTPTNNHAIAYTAVERSADLAIDILDTPDPVRPGYTLTYTLVYTNFGPSNAIDLLLTDHLPANVDYVKAVPAVCVHTVGTPIVTCLPSDLQAAHSAQILLVVSVKPAVEQPLVNEVEIGSATPDPNSDNNLSAETTIVDGEPPSITWVAPVNNEDKYYVMIRPGLEITLTAIVTDNVKLNLVRFTRWDHRAKMWVPLGVFGDNPSHVYELVMTFDSCLDLPPGDNGIYVFAYDTAGNWDWKRIWIVPDPYPVLLPLMMKK